MPASVGFVHTGLVKVREKEGWTLPVAINVILPVLRVSPSFCLMKTDRMPAIKMAPASEKTATRAVGMDRSRIGRGREEGLPWSLTHRGKPVVVCLPPFFISGESAGVLRPPLSPQFQHSS